VSVRSFVRKELLGELGESLLYRIDEYTKIFDVFNIFNVFNFNFVLDMPPLLSYSEIWV
jgi:hypothetical protein